MYKWHFDDHTQPKFNNLCALVTKFAKVARYGEFPSDSAWECLSTLLGTMDEVAQVADPADVAVMLYCYHTRRKNLPPSEKVQGKTSRYTGVIQELVGEIPTHGSERLRRKLSVDISCLIPRLFVGFPNSVE